MRNIFKVLAVIGGWILWKLRIKRDESVIPEGPYCYSPVEAPSESNGFIYKTKPCPYYKFIRRDTDKRAGLYGCSYLGILTDDSVFGDQCKMCSFKDYLDSDPEYGVDSRYASDEERKADGEALMQARLERKKNKGKM